MSYYKDKKKALRIIDKMYEAGNSIEEIEYRISKGFGFGRSMILSRFKLLDTLASKNLVNEDEEV